MRVTRTQAEENRNRVIDVAGRLFRERGFDGIGISDLMAAAGLTHGGFYNNFASKDELAALACSRALEASRARLKARAADSKGDAFGGWVRAYLSKQHRDDPGHGCALTTLAAESPRREQAVRSTISSAIDAYLDLMIDIVPGETSTQTRADAITALSAMLGAVILSRATIDKKLSAEFLKSVEATLTARHPGSQSPAPEAPQKRDPSDSAKRARRKTAVTTSEQGGQISAPATQLLQPPRPKSGPSAVAALEPGPTPSRGRKRKSVQAQGE